MIGGLFWQRSSPFFFEAASETFQDPDLQGPGQEAFLKQAHEMMEDRLWPMTSTL
ncbi:hypothetical protein [Parasaccharibacter sp. TMW 2.1891]|uniref:hypothetical protein n=1 Tax=Parasaccharibacter sp. TMW 2.1891 TaxID=2267836 RepID=UPI002012EFA1|nr:hypothetical protein [Parasaccharibacter sp. TMW 2.1891]